MAIRGSKGWISLGMEGGEGVQLYIDEIYTHNGLLVYTFARRATFLDCLTIDPRGPIPEGKENRVT